MRGVVTTLLAGAAHGFGDTLDCTTTAQSWQFLGSARSHYRPDQRGVPDRVAHAQQR